MLLCIGTGKAFSDQKRLRYEAQQFFLKTAAEMAGVFGDHPEAAVRRMNWVRRELTSMLVAPRRPHFAS